MLHRRARPRRPHRHVTHPRHHTPSTTRLTGEGARRRRRFVAAEGRGDGNLGSGADGVREMCLEARQINPKLHDYIPIDNRNYKIAIWSTYQNRNYALLHTISLPLLARFMHYGTSMVKLKHSFFALASALELSFIAITCINQTKTEIVAFARALELSFIIFYFVFKFRQCLRDDGYYSHTMYCAFSHSSF